MRWNITEPVHAGGFVGRIGGEGRCHRLLPAPGGVWIVAFTHRCNRSSAVSGGGRGGFQTRPYATGNGRSETRLYGMGSARLTHATPLRFGQAIAGYGRSLPKSTSCAWNRFT